MRAFLLTALLLPFSGLAQTSDAGYPPLPGTKVDNYITTVPSNQTVRAAEFNNFVQNVQQVENQLSGAVQNYVALSSDAGLCTIDDLMVGPTATTHCSQQVSGGLTVQGSTTLDGGAYVNGNMVVDGGHTVIGNLVVNGSLTVDGGSNIGVWQLGWDCLAQTQPLALLPNTDGGTFTLCSQTLTRVAVNYSKGGDAIDGGLLMQCIGTGASGLSSVADGVYIPLAQVIPGFRGDTPVWIGVWWLNPTTVGASTSQFELQSVDNFPLSSQTGVVETFAGLFRQMSGWDSQDYTQSGGSNVSTSFNDGTTPSGFNVGEMYFPSGVAQGTHTYAIAIYDGGVLQPNAGDTTLNFTAFQSGAGRISYYQGPANGFNIFLNCDGTAATAYVGRISIWYRP